MPNPTLTVTTIQIYKETNKHILRHCRLLQFILSINLFYTTYPAVLLHMTNYPWIALSLLIPLQIV